jgi:hypothetical protein
VTWRRWLAVDALGACYVAVVVLIAVNNANPGAAVAIALGTTAALAIALAVWLLPVFIARKRGARNFGSIVAITLLLGWTVVGWVAALAMALADTKRPAG